MKENNIVDTRTYDLDQIDDVIRELDAAKIKVNALMDYNLRLRRLNDQEPNKKLMAHEFNRLSPIMELLNTDIFESIDKAIEILNKGNKAPEKE
ncbi:hypothetical protein [Companilactobacillus sp. FL22-1]|uniref:hypothetical protein n=1 Tax=Companilactobacillus sp. FL22-1 TaxID=3373892 RepID=UPI0037545D42